MKTHVQICCRIITFTTLIIIFAGAGCEQRSAKRHYREVLIDTREQARIPGDDPHAFLRMMPQDEIHANLKAPERALPNQMQSSSAKPPLAWTTPAIWSEKKGSGMRLAVFTSRNQEQPVETTIISLGGRAGGLSANVVRWMKQINLNVPEDQELQAFLDRQERFATASNLSVVWIDLSQRQTGADPEVPSMIAAIIESAESQIFVKMTGSKRAVLANREPLKMLVQSIKVNE